MRIQKIKTGDYVRVKSRKKYKLKDKSYKVLAVISNFVELEIDGSYRIEVLLEDVKKVERIS